MEYLTDTSDSWATSDSCRIETTIPIVFNQTEQIQKHQST
jgi:hypothetical protein